MISILFEVNVLRARDAWLKLQQQTGGASSPKLLRATDLVKKAINLKKGNKSALATTRGKYYPPNPLNPEYVKRLKPLTREEQHKSKISQIAKNLERVNQKADEEERRLKEKQKKEGKEAWERYKKSMESEK